MKFKQILLREARNQRARVIIENGLNDLAKNSHLVTSQVRDNLYHFTNSLDYNKLQRVFGDFKKVLGAGVFGAVYRTSKGVVKFTFDYVEAPFLDMQRKEKYREFVQVKDVYRTEFGESEVYIIVRDGLTPGRQSRYATEIASVLSDYRRSELKQSYDNQAKEEIKEAINRMCEFDSDWRGTHVDNFGVQNGRIVLYDGFSKNARYDPKGISEINLKKKM